MWDNNIDDMQQKQIYISQTGTHYTDEKLKHTGNSDERNYGIKLIFPLTLFRFEKVVEIQFRAILETENNNKIVPIHINLRQGEYIAHCWQSRWWWRRWRWRRRWSWSSRAGTSPPLSHQSKVLYVKVQFQQRQHLWETTGPSQWPSSSSPCMPLGSLMRYSRLRPSARWRWSHLC